MGDVTVLNTVTSLDLPADRILDAAKEIGMEGVVIVGYTKDGDEYFASSYADGGTTGWHLDRAKYKLLKIVDDQE